MITEPEKSGGDLGEEKIQPTVHEVTVVDSVGAGGQSTDASLAIAQLKEEVAEARASFQSSIKDITKTQDELKADKVSFITVSGTFVAIFTFISVEVQIFNHLNNTIQVAGFTCLFAGVLMIFISLIDYVARAWVGNSKNYSHIIIVLLAAALLIILGVWIVSWSWALS